MKTQHCNTSSLLGFFDWNKSYSLLEQLLVLVHCGHIVTVGMVIIICSTCEVNQCPRWITRCGSTHDPSLILHADGTVQTLNPLLLSAISVSHLSSAPHLQGFLQNHASTIGTLSYSDCACHHIFCHQVSALPLAIAVFMLLLQLQVDCHVENCTVTLIKCVEMAEAHL